ncbi:hypothetical protein [Rubritalea tangerina]|uniref:TolC family protein n=1 Tax=Rubritalea tangerina TaxID=430798 RepID=A0ABW4ZCK4_9BACT
MIKHITLCSAIFSLPVIAQDSASEMARKLQNPLANIRALMTDNVVAYNTGLTNDTSFNFQLQPVYAIDFEE